MSKVWLVTGSAGGIGAGIALAALAAGDRVVATNVLGTFNVTRAVLPVLRAQRSGHVINMSSNGGFKGVAGA